MIPRTKNEDKYNEIYGDFNKVMRLRYTIGDDEINNPTRPRKLTEHAIKNYDLIEIIFVGVCRKDIVDKLIKNHKQHNRDAKHIIFIDRTTRRY